MASSPLAEPSGNVGGLIRDDCFRTTEVKMRDIVGYF
jgi:hypothetical protein